MRFLKALMDALSSLGSRGVRLTSPRFGHYAYRIAMVGIVVNLAETAASGRAWIPGPVDKVWDVAYLTGIMYLGIGILEHRARLCEPCIADWPLNGSELAVKRRANLATFHWMSDGIIRFYVVVMASIVAASLAKNAGLINETVEAAIFAGPLFWLFLSMARHSQLEPWCPKCRGGGGGGRIVMPEPDPAVSR